MFCLITFIDFCKYVLILDLMPETSLDRGKERLGKMWTGSLVTSGSIKVGYEKVLESLIVHMRGLGEVQTHDCIKGISTWASWNCCQFEKSILVLLTLYTTLLPFKVTRIANRARRSERLFSWGFVVHPEWSDHEWTTISPPVHTWHPICWDTWPLVIGPQYSTLKHTATSLKQTDKQTSFGS